jgi:mRNA-degrading endonuclease toxin of MazEF toxin-antitoxin module
MEKTLEGLINEVRQLPVPQQLRLIERLARHIQADLEQTQALHKELADWDDLSDEALRTSRRGSPGGPRPAIIVQADTALPLTTVFVVPLTANLRASRFAGTFVMEALPGTGLQARSVVLAFQLRAIDRDRVGERLGALTSKDLITLESHLRSLLAL